MRAVHFDERRGQRRLRPFHGNVCAVPRLRAGLSQRRAVRSADGGHPRHAGRSEAHDALVATPRLPRARPPSPAARRLDVLGSCTAPATWCRSGWVCRVAIATRGVSPVADRRRDMAVHRLRDGCLATRHASQHRQGARGRRCHVSPARRRRRVLRRAARPRRSDRRGRTAGPSGDAVDARRGADRGQFGGLWRSIEGLRSPARHDEARRVQRPGARRQRVRRPTDRSSAGSAPTRPGDRAGSVPLAPRAARPPAGAHSAGRGRRCRRARRRGAVLRRRRRVLHAAARARRADPRAQAGGHRPGRTAGGRQRQSWVLPSISPLPACTSSTPWISSPRRCDGGRYDDLVDRLQVVVDDLDQIVFDQLREAAAEGKPRPTDDKRLTQARRAVEKAIHLLRGGSDVDE